MKTTEMRAAVRAAMAAMMVFAMAQPARADVFATIGAEVTSWVSTFDTSFFPVLVTVGLLMVVGTWFINKMAAVTLFVGVVVGALMYGARDVIIGFGA